MTHTTAASDLAGAAARKSNRQIAAESLDRLRAWLDAAERVPERNGKANISAIALAAEVDRQVLYRDEAQAMIAAAVAAKGLGMPAQERAAEADGGRAAAAARRIKALEEQLAVSRAEAADLRGRLSRYEHLEQHMTETGLLPR